MNTGLGNAAVRSSKVTPPTPATVTAANNGLSLSGTTVQLGQAIGAVGNPAILLSNREIPFGGFNFALGSVGDRKLFIDNTNLLYQFGDIDGGAGNESQLKINDNSRLIQFLIDSGRYFELDLANRKYSLGDLDGGAGSETQLILDDLLSTAKINNNGLNFLSIDAITNDHVLGDNNGLGSIKVVLSGTNSWSYLQGSKAYLGDFENGFQHTYFGVEARLFFAESDGNQWFRIETTTGLCKLGDIDTAVNGTFLEIDDANQTAIIKSGGVSYFNIDKGSNTCVLGDNTSSGRAFVYINQQIGGHYLDLYAEDVGAATFSEILIQGVQENVEIYATNGVKIIGDTTLLHTGTALSNNAGAGLGTLTNSPTAGDPAKWIAIDDNGTTRFIPTWL